MKKLVFTIVTLLFTAPAFAQCYDLDGLFTGKDAIVVNAPCYTEADVEHRSYTQFMHSSSWPVVTPGLIQLKDTEYQIQWINTGCIATGPGEFLEQARTLGYCKMIVRERIKTRQAFGFKN